jgi:hypothetical protein
MQDIEHYEWIEEELSKLDLYTEFEEDNNLEEEEIDEDELVIDLYMLHSNIQMLTDMQKFSLIKYLENYFDSEKDTELGEFLNELIYTYLFTTDDNSLHDVLRDLIRSSNLDLSLIKLVQTVIYNIFKQ